MPVPTDELVASSHLTSTTIKHLTAGSGCTAWRIGCSLFWAPGKGSRAGPLGNQRRDPLAPRSGLSVLDGHKGVGVALDLPTEVSDIFLRTSVKAPYSPVDVLLPLVEGRSRNNDGTFRESPGR